MAKIKDTIGEERICATDFQDIVAKKNVYKVSPKREYESDTYERHSIERGSRLDNHLLRVRE